MRPIVCIDPGHGGRDPGALSPHGPPHEKDVVLCIAKELAGVLVDAGADPRLTRETDIFIPIGDRARMANAMRAALFVSIHCNAAQNRAAHGIETFHHPASAQGARVAARIQSGMMARFPQAANRGVKTATFQVLRETAMPAVLAECEFISHQDRARELATANVQRAFAGGIADGIIAHLGLSVVSAGVPRTCG